MEIIITETKEEKELTLVSPKTGCEWTMDFINNGDLATDDDDNWVMTQEDFEWWKPVVEAYQEADNAVYDVYKTLEDPSEFLDAVHYAQNCDLEDQSAAMMAVVEEYK